MPWSRQTQQRPVKSIPKIPSRAVFPPLFRRFSHRPSFFPRSSCARRRRSEFGGSVRRFSRYRWNDTLCWFSIVRSGCFERICECYPQNNTRVIVRWWLCADFLHDDVRRGLLTDRHRHRHRHRQVKKIRRQRYFGSAREITPRARPCSRISKLCKR